MKNNNPLVSVIMPAFNAEEFISQSIESIVSQTYINLELIIVDDASTDGTWKIICKYRKKYPGLIKAVRLKQNLGAGGDAAGNVAFRLAQGEFVARTDADDMAFPERIERQVTFLNENPDISLVGSWVHVIDKDGNVVGQKKVPVNHDDIYKEYFVFHPMINPTLMVRRSVFEKSGRFYELKNKTNNDYLTSFKLITNGIKFANLPEKLVYYRVHGRNDSLARVKRTFLNSLRTRYLAVVKFGYRPTFLAFLKLMIQIPVVLLLPEKLTFHMYLITKGITHLSDYVEFPKFELRAFIKKILF